MNDGSNEICELLDDIREEQRASWTRGERVLVETLLDQHPALNAEESLVELIYSEFCLREATGEDASPADYLERFPAHINRLRRLFEVHEALENDSPNVPVDIATEAIGDLSTNAIAARPVVPTKPGNSQTIGNFADYELLEEIARGGMGVVYKAWQRGADRIVALKMILAGRFASEVEVQRFRTEAQAAARLDHVNIVPIYSVGEHEQHQYFSMAYIDGESLAQRVARGPLDPRKASRLIRDIANGVQYAHQSGIVHRDLKPANILLNKAGIPKIADFGLAKRLEADGPTATGDILGTPAYMAPEYAKAAGSQAETLGDVYSLGALLYCLLTGRPPFQAATAIETLAQVIEQEPVAPRQLNKAIERDLETICLTCLEKEPSRRYASADALADDLERFLSGEPIHARKVSRFERVWRWCKRKPLVASLASLSVLLTIGLMVALATGYAHQTRLRRAADSARRLADTNAEMARQQADLALHSLERVVFDIQRKLEHVPAAAGVRREMLASVIEQLDRVARNLATHDLADHHTAVAHVELGDIFLSINGDGMTSGVEQARREYETANKAFRQMHEADPENDFVQHNLAISWGKLAKIEQALGHLQAAVRLQTQGLRLLNALHRRFPGDTTYAKSVADAWSSLGELLFSQGNLQRARKAQERSRDMLRKLLRDAPVDRAHQRSLAVVYNFLGTIHLRQSQLQLAQESYEASLELREQLASEPDSRHNLEAQIDLAIGLRRLGAVLLQRADVKRAGPYYQRSLDVIARAAEADPGHRVVQQQLASSRSKLGELALRTGQLHLAKRHFEQVEQIDAELVRRNPDSFLDRMDLAAAKQQLGDALKQVGDLESAKRLYGEALAILEDLRSRGDESSLVLENHAAACLRLGDTYQRLGDLKAAAQWYDRELAVERELAIAAPSDMTKLRGVYVALGRLGDLELQRLELDEAIAFHQESLVMTRRLAVVAPDDRQTQRDLIVALGRMANTYQARGEHESAEKAFIETVEFAKDLAVTDSRDTQAQESLASAYIGLAATQRFGGDNLAARETLMKSLAIRERLARSDRADADAQYKLSLSHERLFDLLWAIGKTELARPHIEACAEIRDRLAATSPSDARLVRARMVAMDRQGQVSEYDGNLDAAGQYYQREIGLVEDLLELDPSDTQTRIDLLGPAYRLAYVQQRQFDFAAAALRFEQGLRTLRELEVEGSLEQRPELRPYLQRFQDQITRCEFYEQVADELAFVLEQDEQRVGYLLYERSQILARRGEYDAAATTIETLVKLNGPDAGNLYDAACGYGLCVSALDEQSQSRALSEPEAARRRQFAARAIELLDAAALHGFFLASENADWLMQDPDLKSLRGAFDFQRFARSGD